MRNLENTSDARSAAKGRRGEEELLVFGSCPLPPLCYRRRGGEGGCSPSLFKPNDAQPPVRCGVALGLHGGNGASLRQQPPSAQP